MNQQDKQEPNNKQSVIEDLAVNKDQAAKVKGGNGPCSHCRVFPLKTSERYS